jgi:ABC-type transporter Mla MlaB component
MSVQKQHAQPLIGREEEMAILVHRLQTGRQSLEASPASFSERASWPHGVLLLGEAGIGKTRLATELGLLAQEQGWVEAWFRGDDSSSYRPPYAPWQELVRVITPQGRWSRSVPRSRQTIFQPLAALLPDLFGWQAPDYLTSRPPFELQASHLWEAIFQYLITVTAQKPLILVVDDLQHLDDASLSLLAHVLRRLRDERLIVLMTCRPEDIIPRSPLWVLQKQLIAERVLCELTLEPLTREQIGLLVRSASKDVQMVQVQYVQTWAGGKPDLALILLSLLESGLLRANENDPWKPGAIVTILEVQLRRVSHRCRTLLERMATLDLPCSLDIVFPLVDPLPGRHNEEEALDLLDEAIGQGLVEEEVVEKRIWYRFRHPLLRAYLSR